MRKKRYNYFDDDEEVIRQIRERTKAQQAQQDDTPSPDPQPEKKANSTSSALHSAAAEAKKVAARSQAVARRVAATSRTKFIEEENKSPRRLAVFISLIMILVMIVCTVTVVSININQGVNQDSRFNTEAGQVCNQYATKYGNCNYENLDAYGVSGYRLTGVCCVRQVDFNGNGKSELLICYRDRSTYYAEVWGFRGKSFDMLYKDKICQTKDKKDDVWVTLYYKNGKYLIGKHDEKKPEQVTLLAMRHNRFVKDDTATYDAVSDTFTIHRQVNNDDFERVRMSVLRESGAAIATDNVNDSIAAMMSDEDKEQKTAKKGNSMNAAYYSIVKSLNEKYGVAKFHSNPGRAYVSGLAVVKLLDFDNDGTNELITVYRRAVNEMGEDANGNYHSETVEKYNVAIYSWNGKLATQVFSSDDLSNSLTNDENTYFVLERNGKKFNWCSNHFVSENYGRSVQATSKVLEFNGDSFEQKQKAYYQTDYGYTEYYLNDQWASKTKFADNGGFDVPFFDGGTAYDESRYIVTYVQTKAANQNAVKNVVESTVDTIKNLDSSYSPEDVVSIADDTEK